MANDVIYICGDSISVPDISYKNHHWSEQLSRSLQSCTIKNLAFIGATNFAISAQIEKAIADPLTKMVIVNAADVYRIDVTTKNYKRNDIELPTPIEKFHFHGAKKYAEKIYVEAYQNPLVNQENLLDIILTDMYSDKRLDPRKTLAAFGIWSIGEDAIGITGKEKITNETVDAAMNYFQYIFNLNHRLHEDIAMLEGKLYKMQIKNINFLYNLGGLTNKKGYFYELFPDILEKMNKIYGLDQFYSELNLYDIGETYRHGHGSPAYHIPEMDAHRKISEYYTKRIQEGLHL